MPTIKRDWDLIVNDLLCILAWFERQCSQGQDTSISQCAKDTDIPRTTIYDYIFAYKKWKSGEYKDWWLENVGMLFNYRVKFLGKPGQAIWVSKVQYKEDPHIIDVLDIDETPESFD